MVRLRWVSRAPRVRMRTPTEKIIPKRTIAAPPSTGFGIAATTAATFGTNPRITRNTPQMATTYRLATPVKEMRPTFCENDVFGNAPKTPATALITPSATSPPFNSSPVASRPTDSVVPETSPMVSMAVMTYANATTMIALGWNSTPYRSGIGNAIQPALATPLRSSRPSGAAAT